MQKSSFTSTGFAGNHGAFAGVQGRVDLLKDRTLGSIWSSTEKTDILANKAQIRITPNYYIPENPEDLKRLLAKPARGLLQDRAEK